MPDFQISIQTGGVESVAPGAELIVVNDYSNYIASDEVGHLQADFSDFYKATLTSTLGAYTFSSVGDGDSDIATPSEAIAAPIEIDFPTLGDAKYLLTVIAVPTWDFEAAYLLVNTPYVWFDGIIYKCLQNSTGDQPDGEPTYWEVTTEADIPAKYRVDYDFVNIYSMQEAFAENTKLAVGDQINNIGKDFSDNPYWEKAAKLDNIIEAVAIYATADSWTICDHLIAHSKVIIDG